MKFYKKIIRVLKRSKAVRFFYFYKEFLELGSMKSSRMSLAWEDRYPCLYDSTAYTGFDRHYIYHPAWAIRILSRTKPCLHVDISSTLAFCSMSSAFFKTEFYDYRPPKLSLGNLEVKSQDLQKLTFENNSISSLSCMHVIEHIGLGRYGDALDFNGDIKGIRELSRVLSPEGNLLFVVPVGKVSKIQFNAHRVYKVCDIITEFEKYGLKLKEFTLIPEDEKDGGLVVNPAPELLDRQHYACGCFWFTK